jgi:hypothetical protein
MRVSLAVALTCCGMLALISGVVLHGACLVGLLIAAGLVACVAHGVRDNDAAPRGAVALEAAGATTAIGMVATGVGVLAGPAIAMAVTASAMVAAGGLVWLRRRSAATATAAPARPGRTPAPTSTDPLLPVSRLSTPALCGEWMDSTAALAGRPDPAVWQEVVRRRAEALDELERRDPAGVARWVTAGRGLQNDPADFLREGRTMGTDAG